MESWCLISKHHKSSLLMFIIFMMMFMVAWIQADERKALLQIKASLHEFSYHFDVSSNVLPTWVDDGSTYCDWERVNCNSTTGYVTGLSLHNMFSFPMEEGEDLYSSCEGMIWPLKISVFLHFKELTRLDLSWNFIGNTFVTSGLEKLSSLKKLEILNLSANCIATDIFPSLNELTSLKHVDLSYNSGSPLYSPTHDISVFRSSPNLEVLDLTGCNYYGTFQMQGLESGSKLKILNLGRNKFNESIITSLTALPSLEALDLGENWLSGSFPSQELSKFSNLKKLDLSWNNFNITPSMEGCKSLMRLERLESVTLGGNSFNKSIISCLSFLPSLNFFDLTDSSELGSSFPMQELSSLRELKTLDLSGCNLESIKFNGSIIMSNLLHLNLDGNNFVSVDDLMRSMTAFPSLTFLSLSDCYMRGRLFANEVPNLPYLKVLILRWNFFKGTLPMEALTSFHHLEVLDLTSTGFVGSIPPTIKSLSSLKVLSLANNALNGSLTNNGLCDLKNLQELYLNDNMFDGNVPKCFNRLSSLKLFDISSNQFTGILLPSLFTNLTSLEYIDFNHNKFEGSFSFSSFSNHTKLEFFQFERDTSKFEVETEEPVGWIPMFQLKFLALSNLNLKMPKGSVVPGFLLHQRKLRILDLSHNSFKGQLPTWLLKNNTNLLVLILRNNSFQGIIHMGYKNANLQELDISENNITGTIPENLQNSIPYIQLLNFSSNAISGVIPTSVCDLSKLMMLDLSNNKLSGEVPKGFFTNFSRLEVIKLSNNKLNGDVLSGNLSLGSINTLQLDENCFVGNIGNLSLGYPTNYMPFFYILDISDNFFTGRIPSWMSDIDELLVRNNRLEGQFPCMNNYISFLDISRNSFSGPLPSCLNLKNTVHLHLGSNRFTGLVPDAFRNLTNVLTLDISHNYLSGTIPEFLGELSNLRILLLGNNNFVGSIPEQLCQLNDVSLMDISNNSLTGSIPHCLKNITGPKELAFIQGVGLGYFRPDLGYGSLISHSNSAIDFYVTKTQDEAQFTTKNSPLTYKGNILDYMSGVDLSCNKLTGEIPKELGMLAHILALNLSHNKLIGPIPVSFSNLAKIESLDLSSNNLSGNVPSELNKLNFLEVFDVSHNNLSGRLPDWKEQFDTFPKESFEGNPFLCGPPLENNCTTTPHVSDSSTEKDTAKWYDIDKASFYGSSSSTWFLFMLGFAAALYINPYWCRRWLELVEECMYICYYFFYDFVRNLYMLFHV